MKRYSFVTALFAALAAGSGAADAQHDNNPGYPQLAASLCRAPEIALFTCDIRSKKVSICGDEAHGRAVYRFERPSHIDLKATNLLRSYAGWAAGGETQVYTATPTNTYIVYARIVRIGHDDEGHNSSRFTSGVVIQSQRRVVADLECTGLPTFEQRLLERLVPGGVYIPH